MFRRGRDVRYDAAMTAVVLIVSLAVVTAGAEALVRGASGLALRLGVSPLFVGLTIVGFGTSSPELAASITATLRGVTDVSVGNVVGSNIFNVAVILGIAALIYPIRVKLAAVRRDLGVAIAASVVPLAALLFDGRIGRAAGGTFVVVLAVYLVVSYRAARHGDAQARERARGQLDTTVAVPSARPGSPWRNVLFVVAGLLLLIAGARYFVGAAIDVARSLGWSERVIGLTIVAAGTSLPELATSVVAGIRRSPDIAIGNVIGSNIFNVLGILGASAMIRPQGIARAVMTVDVPVMLAVTLALLPIMKTGGRISRVEGAMLLGGYGVYLAFLLGASGGL